MGGTSFDRHTLQLDSGPSKKLWTWHRKMRSFRYVVPCCVYTWTVPWLKRLGNRYNGLENISFRWAGNVGACMNQRRCEQLTLKDLHGVDGELVDWATISITDQHVFLRSFWTHLNCWKKSFQQPWILSGFVVFSSKTSIHRSQIPPLVGVPEAISIRKLGHFWRDLCLKDLWKVGGSGMMPIWVARDGVLTPLQNIKEAKNTSKRISRIF